jgi:sec-independent protein translocase protein TatB
MFGLSAEKVLILGILAAIILGPDRLPDYARKLAQFVKSVRKFAENANSQMKDELGDGFEEMDWRKLDPRQYDPRRIVREALLEDVQTTGRPRTARTNSTLEKGEPAPFDSEAT